LSRTQHAIVMFLAALCLVAVAANVALSLRSQAAQAEVAQRQQFVQQSVQLEGLYREIVRALAELAARNNDEDVRGMLQRHGISYSVNPTPPAAATGARK
jgi:sensor domain CHASE-containing protein